MKAVRRVVRIDDPSRVVLEDLPFCKGQEVEILVLSKEEVHDSVEELRRLFHRTQALPQARALTEEEILAEVDAFRSGR
jgi:hypothetical protein